MQIKEKVKDDMSKDKDKTKVSVKKALKEPLTYTKKLTAIIVTLWILAYVVAWIVWVLTDRYNQALMDCINTLAIPTILSYSVKSGYEFKVRSSTMGVTHSKSDAEDPELLNKNNVTTDTEAVG